MDAPPANIRDIPGIKQRVEAVRDFRLASKKEPTKKKANDADALRRNSATDEPVYHDSSSTRRETRKYVPFGYFDPNVIVHDSCSAFPTQRFTTSAFCPRQCTWRGCDTFAGGLKSDYRYSTRLVYNNYPWPEEPRDKQRAAVEAAAQAVLDARKKFPDATLADLYDPLAMPPALVKAHADLDRAVDRCYRPQPFNSDRQRVEYLFALYEKLTAPLIPPPRKGAERRSRIRLYVRATHN